MFSSMTSSVTNWLGNIAGNEAVNDVVTRPTSTDVADEKPVTVTNVSTRLGAEEEKGNEDVNDTGGPNKSRPKLNEVKTEVNNEKQEHKVECPEGANTKQNENVTGDTVKDEEQSHGNDMDLDEMSAKAINTAKEWGNYLFNFGKAATEQVSKTAIQIKNVVEEKTILGEFAKEQEKFVHEKREKAKLSEAAVPPWVGYNEEDAMKQQILALSQDKRNFLRNPPTGVQFQFDFEASFPVALATLPEDPNLKEMRFELVPKLVTEENFWRNYFYRVSLIKQSTQLTSLAQQSGSTGESSSSSRRSSTGTDNDKETKKSIRQEPDELPTGSPPDHEFISDAFQDSQLNEDDVKTEMEQLGMKEQKIEDTEIKQTGDDIPDWEKELQAELQEYEVVDDGKAFDDELDEEILQEIEHEANMK